MWKWFVWLLWCLALHVLCKPRRKKGKSFVSGHLTFLCATLKACLVKSSFTAAVGVWFVLVHYEELVSDMMLALSIESERLCSLTNTEWVWDQCVSSGTIMHHNVCNIHKNNKNKNKNNDRGLEHLVMVSGCDWRVSLPTWRKTHKKTPSY